MECCSPDSCQILYGASARASSGNTNRTTLCHSCLLCLCNTSSRTRSIPYIIGARRNCYRYTLSNTYPLAISLLPLWLRAWNAASYGSCHIAYCFFANVCRTYNRTNAESCECRQDMRLIGFSWLAAELNKIYNLKLGELMRAKELRF